MSSGIWYPIDDSWVESGNYKVKLKLNADGDCTDILIADGDLSDAACNLEHVHFYALGTPGQGATWSIKDAGKNVAQRIINLSDSDIARLVSSF